MEASCPPVVEARGLNVAANKEQRNEKCLGTELMLATLPAFSHDRVCPRRRGEGGVLMAA